MKYLKLVIRPVLAYLAISSSLEASTKQIPNFKYLVFSANKAEIASAKVRQPLLETNTSRYRKQFFKVKFLENSYKNKLIEQSNKKYYKFLLDPFEISTQAISNENTREWMTP